MCTVGRTLAKGGRVRMSVRLCASRLKFVRTTVCCGTHWDRGWGWGWGWAQPVNVLAPRFNRTKNSAHLKLVTNDRWARFHSRVIDRSHLLLHVHHTYTVAEEHRIYSSYRANLEEPMNTSPGASINECTMQRPVLENETKPVSLALLSTGKHRQAGVEADTSSRTRRKVPMAYPLISLSWRLLAWDSHAPPLQPASAESRLWSDSLKFQE